MTCIFHIIWILGVDFTIDEMIICFQGMSYDKRLIIYKSEGDGFQCDALFQDEFCYQFYFRNESVPEEYVKLGFFPIQYRVMSIFDTVKYEHRIS